MRLVLTGRHLEISPGLRTLVERKLQKLERLLGDTIVSAQVVCAREKTRRTAEVTVHMRGDHILAGRGSGDNWQQILTAAVARIEKQGAKVKGKWRERKRQAVGTGRAANAPPDTVDGAAAPAPAQLPRIVRVSRAQLKPMTVETAAQELAGTGEPFLVFRNADTDTLNVLLRRRRGEFGLVEPDR